MVISMGAAVSREAECTIITMQDTTKNTSRSFDAMLNENVKKKKKTGFGFVRSVSYGTYYSQGIVNSRQGTVNTRQRDERF